MFLQDADYGAATQRDCMQRAPSDGKERCAFIKYRNKQVFMCFCKGDLCNEATAPAPAPAMAAMAAMAAILALWAK